MDVSYCVRLIRRLRDRGYGEVVDMMLSDDRFYDDKGRLAKTYFAARVAGMRLPTGKPGHHGQHPVMAGMLEVMKEEDIT